MVPELSLEIIYYKQKTDFKTEFELCSVCSVRFLSTITNEKPEFVKTLKKSLTRSRCVVVVGNFSSGGKDYIPGIVANAVGINLTHTDTSSFGITDKLEIMLPNGSVPLVLPDGQCAGCVLENADQSIIILTSSKEERQSAVSQIVCPYLKFFSEKKPGTNTVRTVRKSLDENDNNGEIQHQYDIHPQSKSKEEVTDEKSLIKNDKSAEICIDSELIKNDCSGDDLKTVKLNPSVGNTWGNNEERAKIFAESEGLSAIEQAEALINSALKAADEIVSSVKNKNEQFKIQPTSKKSDDEINSDNTENKQIDDITDNVSNQECYMENSENVKMEYHNPEISVTGDSNPQDNDMDIDISADNNVGEKGDSDVVEAFNKQYQENGYAVLEQPDSKKDELYYSLMEERAVPKKKKRIFRAVISVILVICVVIGAYFGYEFVYQPMHCKTVYGSIQELYGQLWEGLPEEMLYKFGKLYNTNSDIIGWLSLPEAGINFPVVTSVNKPSKYYQSHLFEGSVSSYGTPFTNQSIENDGFFRNIVINGKSFSDGSMFSGLSNYLDIDNYRKSPTFTFDTVFFENKWKIFSVFERPESMVGEYSKTEFFDDNDFSEYVEKLKSASVIDTGIDVIAQDELVTLISDFNDNRVIIVARKVRDGESPLADVTESRVKDYISESSTVPTNVKPSVLTELESSSNTSSTASVDKSMEDNGSSRYEQQGPVSSAVTVKPNYTVTPSSSKVQVSSSQASSSKFPSVSSSSAVTSSSNVPSSKLPTLTVTNQNTGSKVSGKANDIIASVIEAEMGSGYNIEALKAQAVATYSWLLCNGANSGGAPAVPMKTAGTRSVQAADQVAGIVAVYGGKVAQTYYYAISAGYTANCQDVWQATIPYLVSVNSSVDKNVNGYQTVRTYTSGETASWVRDTLGVDLTKIADKSSWFKCTYDKNGLYVTNVNIGGVNKKGPYLREKIFTAARAGSTRTLRSSAYTIVYNKSEDRFVFTVKGYGHGIGMSQVGANAYANSGWSYDKILKYYYTGISLGVFEL